MKTPQNLSTAKPGRLNQIKLLSTAALLAAAAVSQAQSFYTNNASGDFNVATSWSPNGVPSGTVNSANDNGSNNVVLIQPGDPLWQHGDTLSGTAAGTTGAWLQTGSTNNTGGGNWLRMGLATNSFGSYVLSNGVVNVGGRIQIGEQGAGYLEISGGTMTANVNDAGANPGLGVANGNFNLLANNRPVGTVVINSGTLSIKNGEVWFGNGGNDSDSRGTGHFVMHGGTFNVNNWFVFGRFGAAGDGYMDGGVINKNNSGNVQIGVGSMNTGGTGGQGYFTQMGGTFNCGSEYQIGTDATVTTATNDIGGNAILKVDNWIAVGRSGATGVLNISGNAAITKTGVNGGNVTIGTGSTGNGIINQNGGTFTNTATQTWISEGGTATWNMTNGQAILGTVILAHNSSGSGVINLVGGLFRATSITSPNPLATTVLNFDGGTLQAGGDNNNFVGGLTAALMDSGGAVIDSQGFNIQITQALQDYNGGGLTKLGSGTLTLSGANNYSGPTMVNAGKLITSTSSSTPGNVTVADTAGFGVIVQSAGGQYIANNVSLGTATGGSLDFNLGGFGNPSLSQAPLYVSSGTFTANGTITVNIADALPQVGEFPLVQYQPAGRSGNGKFVIGSLPSGVIANIVTNAGNNSIDLNITGVNQPRWDGQAGGTWDAGSDTNWVNIGTGLPTTYTDPSSVLFDDNALGTTTVNLTATVSPLSVMVANNSLSYTFVGTGKISGSTSLNKQGSGTLAILNTGGNAYTGPTVISGGTLAVTNLANGGLPSPIGASSSDPTNLVINSTLSYGGAPLAVDRGFTVASNNCTINTTGDLTLSGKVNALTNSSTGGSALNKTGLARLTFTTSGLNEFSRSYKPGIHTSQGTLVFDGSAGGQTNHCESEFWIGNTNGTGGSVILTNTTLISDSWLGMGRSSSLNTTSTFTLYNSTYQMGNCSLGYDNGVSGYQGTQILTLNGSSVFTNRGDLNLGESSGATVAIAVNGNSLLYSQNRGLFCMGNGNSGTMTVANNGKVIINNGWFSIGAAPNANASLVLKDSASLSVSSDFNVTDVGLNCTSVVTVADSAQVNANNIFVGKDTGVSATLNITNNAAVTSVNGLTMATFFDNTPRIPNVAVVNLAGGSLGVNLVQGSVTNSVNYGVFNFAGGKLMIHGPYFGGHDVMFNLQAANILAGGAFIDVGSTDSVQISQALLGGNGDGGLTKTGSGTLYLNGANTYTNATLVNAGSLGGSGTILGRVTVASGATLVGDSGTVGSSLVINNTLTLSAGSTTFMKVTPSSNDQITGLAQVNYGGTLVVSNTSASPLTDGQTFVLFSSASAGNGNFSSVSVLPAGSFTGTFNPANGILTIHAAATPVVVNAPTFSGGNIIMTGSGNPGDNYTWLSTTNLTPPIVWVTNSQGMFSAGGTCTNTYTVTNPPTQFFRLRSP